jgi:molybdenum cofactor cytidylyltransferase
VNNISAIILAAGESRRMGQPKMLLPWRGGTVLSTVIETVRDTGVSDILVVTGGARIGVEAVCARYSVRNLYNDSYASGGMLSSIQRGIGALNPGTRAALICLGDQPQVQKETVKKTIAAFTESGRPLVLPSFQNRRGHPLLVAQSLWPELMNLPLGQSPRDFLSVHEKDILYVPVNNDSILRDIDTPEEYEHERP